MVLRTRGYVLTRVVCLAGTLLWLIPMRAQVPPGISVAPSDSAVDRQGFVYLAGSTSTASLPTTAGVFQPTPPSPCAAPSCEHGFVAKLTPSGETVVWATYLSGGGSESLTGIAIGADGSIYVTGKATSKITAPGAAGIQYGTSQLFVAKMTPDGTSVSASSYFGGSAYDSAVGIKFDGSGNVYLAGTTSSTDFPTTPGAFQRTLGAMPTENPKIIDYCLGSNQFVIKFDSALKTVLYSTLIGTPLREGTYDFAIGADNSVYVAGISGPERECPSWPILRRVNPQGSGLVYSVYAGGQSVVVDPAGNAYVANDDRAWGLGSPQAHVMKVSPSGEALATASIAGHVRAMTVTEGEVGVIGDSWPSLLNPTPGAPGPCLSIHYETSLVPFLARLDSKTLAVRYLGYVWSAWRGGMHKPVSSDRVLGEYPYYSAVPYVILPIGLPPPGTVTCVVNGADYQGSSAAPGEVLSVFGREVGTALPAAAKPDSKGNIVTELSGLRVTANGLPAPVLYADSGQINIVTPFSLSGDRIQFEIVRDGKQIATFWTYRQSQHAGAFTASGVPFGQLAALNQDGSVNSALNGAAPGTVVSVFATGLGAMVPQLPDGAVAMQIANTPAVQPSVTVNNQSAEILYMGNAPGLVQGIVQINLRLPNPLPPRSSYPGTADIFLLYPGPSAKNASGRIWIR